MAVRKLTVPGGLPLRSRVQGGEEGGGAGVFTEERLRKRQPGGGAETAGPASAGGVNTTPVTMAGVEE